MKKGQVFVMSAIIFSSIVLIAIISAQQPATTSDNTEIDTFFQSIMERQPEVVDSGLERNHSIEAIKEQFYTFNRFVERSSISKNLEYEARQLVVLPEKGRAVFINYRVSGTGFSFYDGGWNNQSVSAYQSSEFDVEPDREYRMLIPEEGIDVRFNGTRPRIYSTVRVESGETVYTDALLR